MTLSEAAQALVAADAQHKATWDALVVADAAFRSAMLPTSAQPKMLQESVTRAADTIKLLGAFGVAAMPPPPPATGGNSG